MDRDELLLRALGDWATGTVELAERSGLPPSTVHRGLRHLVRSGHVFSPRYSVYRLTGLGQTVAGHLGSTPAVAPVEDDARRERTAPPAAAVAELRLAGHDAKAAPLARLNGAQATVETPRRRSGSRPTAGSPAAASSSPAESSSRPQRAASRPTRKYGRAPTPALAGPLPAGPLAQPEAGARRPEPPANLEPPPTERERTLRRYRRTAASVPEASATAGADQTSPSLASLLVKGALLGAVAIIGLVAWTGRGGDGQDGSSPAPSPGGWPGY